MFEIIKKFIRKKDLYEGPYDNWNKALNKSIGYKHEVIFNKIKYSATKVQKTGKGYERDSVIFYDKKYDQNFIKILKNISKKKNFLSILDFGGSLGSLYFKYKSKINNKFVWSIIEQKKFVDEGKKNFETNELKFFYDIKRFKKIYKLDILILSSSIQYISNYQKILKELIALNPKYILLLKTPFNYKNQNNEIYIQNVPKKIYKASYPTWVFSYKNFFKHFKENFILINKEKCKPDLFQIEYLNLYFQNKNVKL